MSAEHTDHALMNLSHVTHEFSFGPYFPRISQPLDDTMEIAPSALCVLSISTALMPQLRLSVLPVRRVDAVHRPYRPQARHTSIFGHRYGPRDRARARCARNLPECVSARLHQS